MDAGPETAYPVPVPRRFAPLLALPLAGCGGVLDPVGPVGEANRTILLNALAIMLAIVIPTMLATIAFAWWFRAGNARAKRRPDFIFSGRIELVTWSIPILVVLFLSGVIWTGSHRLDPWKPLDSPVPPIEVDVVSLDWKWLFIYPGQGIATVNSLIVPAGTPIRFRLTSASVMNAFFVPRLGSMIYVMNGMETQLNLQADTPGIYHGQSSHFSGDGFSAMHFQLRAVPPAEFVGWAAAAKGHGPALDRAAYGRLARQGTAPAFTYGATDPLLFGAIVRQHISPAPGPNEGRGGPGVSPRERGK